MQSPKTKSAQFTTDADSLFAAVNSVIESGKYTRAAADPENRKVSFTSGKTLLSWGHEYIVAVEDSGGVSTLSVLCGGVDGAAKALLDGWKNGKAADKFIADVRQAAGS